MHFRKQNLILVNGNNRTKLDTESDHITSNLLGIIDD